MYILNFIINILLKIKGLILWFQTYEIKSDCFICFSFLPCFVFIFTLFHVHILFPQGDCRFLVGLLVVWLPSEYLVYVKICMLTHDTLIHPNKGWEACSDQILTLTTAFLLQIQISAHTTMWNILNWSKPRQTPESLLLPLCSLGTLRKVHLCPFWPSFPSPASRHRIHTELASLQWEEQSNFSLLASWPISSSVDHLLFPVWSWGVPLGSQAGEQDLLGQAWQQQAVEELLKVVHQ